jgi:lysozyme family protein
MMDFDTAFNRLIGHEGGYVNDPRDPGGETKFGISKRSYPDVNIASLTVDGAKAIYMRDFWKPLADANPAVKFQVFDFAVNSGIQTAIRKLQAAIGVADDGHWGPISAAKLQSMDVSDVIMLFVAERLDFWRKLKTWPTFGAGWAGRAAENLRYGAKDN